MAVKLITAEEFKLLVGTAFGKTLIENEPAFEAAENAAAEVIFEKTGLALPASTGEAPTWCKWPAAAIICDSLIGTISGISAERLDWSNRQYVKAMAALENYRIATPAGRAGAASGAIEGIPTW